MMIVLFFCYFFRFLFLFIYYVVFIFLLFFAIPEQYMVEDFESGVILFTIIATSIFMTISLIKSKEKENLEEEDINDLLVDEEGADN